MNAIAIFFGVLFLFIVSLSHQEFIIVKVFGILSGLSLLLVGFKLFKKAKPGTAYYLSVFSAVCFFSSIIIEAIVSYKWTGDDTLASAIVLLFYAFLIKKYQPEKKWAWKKGHVNTHEDYMELRFGSIESGGWDDWLPVAYIAAPKNNVFKVKFLTQPLDERHTSALEAATREINFYLVEKEEPEPWSYAQYHCGTAADIYSNIHWAYFPVGWQEKKAKQDTWLDEINNH